MICPKCEKVELKPDHDRINHVECWACTLCGYRRYPEYPPRRPTREEATEQRDGKPLGPYASRLHRGGVIL